MTESESETWTRERIENINKHPTADQLGYPGDEITVIEGDETCTFHVPDHRPADEPADSPFQERFIVAAHAFVYQLGEMR